MTFDTRLQPGEPDRQGNVVPLKGKGIAKGRGPAPRNDVDHAGPSPRVAPLAEYPPCSCGAPEHAHATGTTLDHMSWALQDVALDIAEDRARGTTIGKAQAAAFLAATRKAGAPAPHTGSTAPEFSYMTKALLDDYLAARKARKRADATLQFIAHHSKPLIRLLPALAADITHSVLLGYVATRREEGAGEVVRKELHSILRPALKLAHKSDLFGVDPTKVIPELDSLSKPRERWLPIEEAWAVVRWLAARSSAGRDHAACVAFALATGAEYSAWSRAQRSDMRADGMGARVHGSKRRTRDRFAPSPLTAQQELLRYALDNARGVDAMFTRWAPSNANSDLKEACVALGIAPCSTNDLRRSYASWLGQAGVRDELIQRAMGHRDSVLARHYRQLTDDDLLRLMLDDVGKEQADLRTEQVDPGTTRFRRVESNHDSGIQSPLSYL